MIIINTSSVTGTFTWVYRLDPAFDRESDEFEEAELTAAIEACDPVRLKRLCKPGEEPTYWRLRHVTGEARRWLIDYLGRETDPNDGSITGMGLRKAAAHALCGVENLRGQDGTSVDFTQSDIDPLSKHRVAPASVLNALEGIDGGTLISTMGVAVIRSLAPSGN